MCLCIEDDDDGKCESIDGRRRRRQLGITIS